MRVPTDVDTQHGPTRHLHPAGSLTRFIALRALTLKNGGVRAGLPALPPTLTSLTLDDNTPNAIQMATRLRIAPRLRLGDMVREMFLPASFETASNKAEGRSQSRRNQALGSAGSAATLS